MRLPLTQADSTIGEQLGQYYNGIVPVGYRPHRAAEVGRHRARSSRRASRPGQQSVHTRNKNYWRKGQPYFDQVTVIDFADATAQVNALLGGQVDAITDIPFAQIGVAKSNGGLAILVSQGGGWLPLCMAIDMAPFTDNRVRQAMRLIVDRKAMLEQVLSGLRPRRQRPLLAVRPVLRHLARRSASRTSSRPSRCSRRPAWRALTVDLHTTNGAAGMVDSANVFAVAGEGRRASRSTCTTTPTTTAPST